MGKSSKCNSRARAEMSTKAEENIRLMALPFGLRLDIDVNGQPRLSVRLVHLCALQGACLTFANPTTSSALGLRSL